MLPDVNEAKVGHQNIKKIQGFTEQHLYNIITLPKKAK